jgi:hypothetical protein
MGLPSNLQSGVHWCSHFPTSQSISDLSPIFRSSAERFVRALRNAGADVRISATLRPRQRALLMNMSWRVAQRSISPQDATQMCANGVVVSGQSTVVPINWVHNDSEGNYSEDASLRAARAMKSGYSLVHQPSLTSMHMKGEAIDMTVTWSGTLSIVNGSGQTVTINSLPRDGAGNTALHTVGRSYGVIKLVSDRPHWSRNGH